MSIYNSLLSCGTASALSIGSGTTLGVYNSSIGSSNTNAITGAGTLDYSGLIFPETSKTINTTTQLSVNSGTFTPVLNFGGATTGITYTTQQATYYRLDNVCFFTIYILLSSKGSASGNATITGLPFTAASTPNVYKNICELETVTAAGATMFIASIPNSGTTISLQSLVASTGTGANLTDTNFSNTSVIEINGRYFI